MVSLAWPKTTPIGAPFRYGSTAWQRPTYVEISQVSRVHKRRSPPRAATSRAINAAAALIGAAAAAPSTARAITWKVRDRRPLHWTSRGDGVEVDSIRNGAFLTISMCRRRDGVTPTQDDREDVNAVFMDKYPKAILLESGIALVILALAKAGVGPLGEKFREEGD